MKTRNVLIALAAVAMFAVPVMAQDECTSPASPGDTVNPCSQTANASDPMQCPQGGGGTACTGCWSSSGEDGNVSAWYSFTATSTSMQVNTQGAGGDDHIAVFSGDCSGLPGSLTMVGCGEDTKSPFLNDICVTGLTVGDTYFVQQGVWSSGACSDYTLTVAGLLDEGAGPGTCGNDVVDSPCEKCDGAAEDTPCDTICNADCSCPDPVCGNDVNEAGEGCDGADAEDCPGLCRGPGDPAGECLCPPICGNGRKEGGEQCDGDDALACKAGCQEDCTCAPFCGDGVVNGAEECDPPGMAGCPANGVCLSNCSCGPSRPALPGWGLVGLGLVLLAGVMIVFGRRRTVAGI